MVSVVGHRPCPTCGGSGHIPDPESTDQPSSMRDWAKQLIHEEMVRYRGAKAAGETEFAARIAQSIRATARGYDIDIDLD